MSGAHSSRGNVSASDWAKHMTHKELTKSRQALDENASGIDCAMQILEQSLKELNEEIEKDLGGKKEYEDQISKLRTRKQTLQKDIDEREKWNAVFQSEVGPIEEKYNNLAREIGNLYGEVKDKHKHGVKLLMDTFKYHPSYKRWNDQFTSVPYQPK